METYQLNAHLFPGCHIYSQEKNKVEEMASRLHQIARMGALKEGEDLFRIETTSRARKVANALDGMKR